MSVLPAPALPERVPIVIVGAGLAGLACAEALGGAGRDVLLLDAGVPGAGHDPSLGIARAGPTSHLARLAAGHGEELAAACARAGRRNRDRIAALCRDAPAVGFEPGTLVRLAMAEEADELRRSAAMLRRIGADAEDAAVERLFPGAPPRFVHAAVHADDGVLDTAALVALLEERARARGVAIHPDTRVLRLDDASDVVLQTSRGALHAEIAVVATGAALPQLVSFCRFKIVGMRAQWLRGPLAPGLAGRRPRAWTAVLGRELWRAHADASVCVAGSRALPVQREMGARADTSPEVQALLEANWSEFAAGAVGGVAARGAGVVSLSCDDLPLVGPVPGHPRLLVIGGFGTNTPGLALVAAEVVAGLVATGRAEHAAAFTPRRFL